MILRIVFVCTGNICRSPTAEGVLRHLAAARGLADRVEVASAGLQDWHAGAPPDARSQAHALRRGYDLGTQRARHFTQRDFERFDWIIAMDAGHHGRLSRQCPPQHAHKLRRAADFSDRVPADGVPDPYHGDASGFEAVLDMVEALLRGRGGTAARAARLAAARAANAPRPAPGHGCGAGRPRTAASEVAGVVEVVDAVFMRAPANLSTS